MTKNTAAPRRSKQTPSPATTHTGTRRALRTDEEAASNTEPALRQPDERDQSADQQATVPRDIMKRAHDDVATGQQDTDCRNRIPESLPDQPKTPRNFEESDKLDQAPRVSKTSK